jgi:hypothetical protein
MGIIYEFFDNLGKIAKAYTSLISNGVNKYIGWIGTLYFYF